ncbi:hypothetical protein [Alteromonas sp. a30]|uniref:hypothetical protein n=1 Tax=Alteromonas sp. a30 TaxID=2730917 RepID=UPI00227E51E8|nr:hypothetical protein [Alteromonas sp. a30]MCY7296497.1 hypothetical protein [Alteromonas sp. a30]
MNQKHVAESRSAENTRWFDVPVAQLAPPPVDTELTEAQQAQSQFMPFDAFMRQNNSHCFAQSVAQHQQSWCLQSWIQSYADTLADWLYLLHKQQKIDTSEPVYLLEAQATTGQFGMGLLQALDEKCQELQLESLQICYVFGISEEGYQARLMAHPLFEALAEDSRAKMIQWDVLQHPQLPEQDISGNPIHYDRNPVAFIANGVSSTMPQQLFHVHYSDVYAAQVSEVSEVSFDAASSANTEGKPTSDLRFLPLHLRQKQSQKQRQKLSQRTETHTELANKVGAENKKEQANKTLAYQWQKVTLPQAVSAFPEVLQSAARVAFQQEIAKSRSEILYVPTAAICLQEQLRARCKKGVLCLQSDIGVTSEFHVKQRFSLPENKTEKQPRIVMQKVNFAFIETVQRNASYFCVLNQQNHLNGKVLNITLFDEQEDDWQWVLAAAVEQHFALGTPENAEQVIHMAAVAVQAEQLRLSNTSRFNNQHAPFISENQMLAQLKTHQYEPKLFATYLPILLDAGVHVDQRILWCKTLNHIWNLYTPVFDDTKFAFQLGLFSIDIGHWAMAKQCFMALLQLKGPHLASLHNLALAAFATHDLTLAQQSIETALQVVPNDEQSQKLAQNIENYQQSITTLDWYQPYQEMLGEQDESPPLQLVPLDEHHLAEFLLQYRDPNIAQRLRGVEIESVDMLKQLFVQWKNAGKNNQKLCYAAVHPRLGFVGCVSLDAEMHDDARDGACDGACDGKTAQQSEQSNGEQSNAQATRTETCVSPFKEIKFELKSDDFNALNNPKSHAKNYIISFWIGTDYQGLGFANAALKQAVWQVKRMAKKGLVKSVKTSAWEFNEVSAQVLMSHGISRKVMSR